jgi:hypothetical protein
LNQALISSLIPSTLTMINIRDWESRRTHQAWGTGSGNPALMILTCLVINIIALIVAIVICAFVIEDGSNDLSYG